MTIEELQIPDFLLAQTDLQLKSLDALKPLSIPASSLHRVQKDTSPLRCTWVMNYFHKWAPVIVTVFISRGVNGFMLKKQNQMQELRKISLDAFKKLEHNKIDYEPHCTSKVNKKQNAKRGRLESFWSMVEKGGYRY